MKMLGRRKWKELPKKTLKWLRDYTEGNKQLIIDHYRTSVISKRAQETDFKRHVNYKNNLKKATAVQVIQNL